MRDRLAEVEFSEVRADTIVAAVSGDIDGSNAAELRRAVAERVPSTARSLIMDLTQTTYIDSTGVELLFELARRLSARRQIFTVVVPKGPASARSSSSATSAASRRSSSRRATGSTPADAA